MKFSKSTIQILTNFSEINQSILFKPGNSLKTISVMKNIFAEAKIAETIPKEFAIYNLNEFLNGLRIYDGCPTLNFDNDSYAVMVDDNGNSTKYYYSDPSIIVCPPDKSIELPSKDVCFVVNSDQFVKLAKAASIYGLSDLSAIGDGNNVNLVVRDKENSTCNQFSIVVGETTSTFVFNFKMQNIKMIPGKYEVVVSAPNAAKFTNTDIDLNYFIALEPDSTFS